MQNQQSFTILHPAFFAENHAPTAAHAHPKNPMTLLSAALHTAIAQQTTAVAKYHTLSFFMHSS
jgi:hypothetical protein